MSLDFRIVEKKYSSDSAALDQNEFDELHDLAKELELPMLSRIQDCYGIEGNVHYMNHEIKSLLAELTIIRNQLSSENILIGAIDKLNKILLLAKDSGQSIETLAD